MYILESMTYFQNKHRAAAPEGGQARRISAPAGEAHARAPARGEDAHAYAGRKQGFGEHLFFLPAKDLNLSRSEENHKKKNNGGNREVLRH